MNRAIRKISAVDEVFQALHQSIVSGELPKGYRFASQEVMAEEFGVSRSTIREAVNKLNFLGLLTAKPGVGTIVAGPTANYFSNLSRYIFLASDEVGQFMEGRLYLEKAAVGLAVLRAEEEDIRRLSALVNEQGEAVARGDAALFARQDVQFHQALIEISRNALLQQFLGLIWDGLHQFIAEVTTLEAAMRNAFHFHCLLVRHLARRDRAEMERTLVEHLYDVAVNIERKLGHSLGLEAMFRMEMDRDKAGRAQTRSAS